MSPPIGQASWLDWGFACRPFPGEDESGDQCLVEIGPDRALIALLDGLGHGPEAAEASRAGIEALRGCSGDPVEALMRRCHRSLGGTRGAAVTLVTWNRELDTIEWLAVGNVEAILVDRENERRDSVLVRPGVVGDRLPTLRVGSVTCPPDHLLVLATDGIRSAFAERLLRLGEGSPQELADFLLEEYARDTDDAFVLTARRAAAPEGS